MRKSRRECVLSALAAFVILWESPVVEGLAPGDQLDHDTRLVGLAPARLTLRYQRRSSQGGSARVLKLEIVAELEPGGPRDGVRVAQVKTIGGKRGPYAKRADRLL